MKKRVLLAFVVLFSFLAASEDRTVGLFKNEEDACQGYTLFSPYAWNTTYLIDNEGLLVNSWQSEYEPGLGGIAYLSSDGYLYRSILLETHPVLSGGGATGGFEKLDWDGNVVWHFEYTGDDYHPHHDIEVLPSGNVLMIVWEIKDYDQAIQAGADPSKMTGQELYPDHIIEVAQTGDSTGEIVWQWHAWDHLVQDYSPGSDNFGSVSVHPELIDINARYILISDFVHLNAVSYNQEFDQILVTSPMYDEVWVIDHSTTTEEAAGHTGGNSGKGGDILYRWGNPRFYNQGDTYDQVFFGGHDGNWISSDAPGAGNILVFNNGSYGSVHNYSSIDEFTPPVDEEGNYTGGLPWGPDGLVWTYSAPNPQDFFVYYISGAQRLSNGNTLFCDGPAGEIFEITPEGDLVWDYICPVSDSGPVFQGDSISGNSVFKIRRYAPDFPGFAGKDLTPGKPVELYPDDTSSITYGKDIGSMVKLEIYPDPFFYSTIVTYYLPGAGQVSLKLYNSLGQEVRTLVDQSQSAGSHQIPWDGTDNTGSKVSPGVYFCHMQSEIVSIRENILLIE